MATFLPLFFFCFYGNKRECHVFLSDFLAAFVARKNRALPGFSFWF